MYTGRRKSTRKVSGYSIINEIAETYRGVMIAIPESQWWVFVTVTAAEFASTLRHLASNVCLRAFRKHPLDPSVTS